MKDHVTDAITATPPVGVGVAVIMGMSLSTWVALLTIAYTLVMIVIKLPALMDAVAALRARFTKKGNTDVQGK